MYEETRTYDLLGKTKEDLQLTLEMILATDLNFTTDTEILEENVIKITFYDEKIDKRLQTDNYVIIQQEHDNIKVQIKGYLEEDQFYLIWSNLEKDLKAPDVIIEHEQTKKKEVVESKEEKLTLYEREQGQIIDKSTDQEKEEEIKEKPEQMVEKGLPKKRIIEFLFNYNIKKGFNIDKVEILNFIENFEKKLNKLPTQSEMEAIGFGYIKMLNDEMGRSLTEQDLKEMEAKEAKIEQERLEKERIEKESLEKERLEKERKEIKIPEPVKAAENVPIDDGSSSWAGLKPVEEPIVKKERVIRTQALPKLKPVQWDDGKGEEFVRESARIALKPTPIPGMEDIKKKDGPESHKIQLKPTPLPGMEREEKKDGPKYVPIYESDIKKDKPQKIVQEPKTESLPEKKSKILGQSETGLMIVQKPEGRRKCPKCGNSSPNMIHASTDKTFIISHYPLLYGKKFKCGQCGVEWREV